MSCPRKIDYLKIICFIGKSPYLALLLKEMGEAPGGALKTFWEPEYRMSIPVHLIRKFVRSFI